MNKTDKLVADLLAAIEETERDAESAGESHWESGSESIIGAESGYCVACGPYEGDMEPGDKAHVLRHDPAAVLRRCTADRKILSLHELKFTRVETPPYDAWTGERVTDEYDVECAVCGWVGDNQNAICETIGHLAEGYGVQEATA